MSRRELLVSGAVAAGAYAVTPAFLRDALAAPARAGASPYGPLQAPDANGLMLPEGFRSRMIARGARLVPGTAYPFPIFPDGQATFPTSDGGWILVTNAESVAPAGAGSSAIRFARDGSIRSAYRILGLTNVNCAGGGTPWGTWLSCEEHDAGLVWECDPAGRHLAVPRPALGVFTHEAAAVDPVGRRVYLTEDKADAGFYRFTPDSYPSLESGLLEVAVVAADGAVTWRELPNPTPTPLETPTRQQVPEMARFQNGEGIWYDGGVLYFTTKADKKVWAYDARAERIEVLFDRSAAQDSSLDAVDNVTVSASGDVYVCEDGGNMEIGLITPEREVSPFLRFTGDAHAVSEVCGVVFDPSGKRMYFTSQGAFPVVPGQRGPGAVYEVSGPFRLPAGGATAAFGLAAGERRAGLNPGDRGRALRLRAPARMSKLSLLRRGVPVEVWVDEPSSLSLVLDSGDLGRVRGKGGSTARPRTLALARRRGRIAAGRWVKVRMRPGGRRHRLLRLRRRAMTVRVVGVARAADGTRVTGARLVRVGRR
jgi:uncharacterized protein